MKISKKISLLILFLLAALASNTLIGLHQLNRIAQELRDVARKDIALREYASAIMQHQLERAILFERMISIAEELGFEDPAETRRVYLLDQLQLTKEGFGKIAELGAVNILKAREVIEQGLSAARKDPRREELEKLGDFLDEIERAHIAYDATVSRIFKLISAGDYQLSLADLNAIERKQQLLSAELKGLVGEVRRRTARSLRHAEQVESLARNILLLGLAISLVVGAVIAGLIVRGIVLPLRDLERAAGQIAEGDFAVHLPVVSRDETGEVSRAFNTMSDKLVEFRSQIEQKNRMLAANLELTDSQKKDLERINTELDSFVYTVSHDIAAPLTGIAGYGSYLEKNYRDVLDEKGMRSVKGIRRSAERLNALIKDLLTLSRISRIKNPYENANIQRVAESVLERLEFNIREADVDVHVPENLPVVRCDRIKITEVFFNLINNAVKFSSRDNKTRPRVEIGYADRHHYHEFYVRDNGIGIDPKDHKEVFGMFRRLNPSREYEGTGAGLSIVKKIVEDHGGKIWIDSRVGEGSAFFFTIPKHL